MGVKFTSVFSAVDMAENLSAKAGKPVSTCGYFGLLGAEFDPETGTLKGDYYEKPSYFAFQNLCAVFCENVVPKEIPVVFLPKQSKRVNGWDCPTKELIWGGISKANGSVAFAYWNSTDLHTVQGYEGTVTFEIACPGQARLVDLMDGSVYLIGGDVLKEKGDGLYVFENIPVRDYPLLLTFGDFL